MTPLPNPQLKGQHNFPIDYSVQSVKTLCHCKMKYPVSVTTRHSYTLVRFIPVERRSFFKERVSIESSIRHLCLPSASPLHLQIDIQVSSRNSQATKQRLLKGSSPKMFVVSNNPALLQRHHYFYLKIFLLSKKFQEIHGLVSIIT